MVMELGILFLSSQELSPGRWGLFFVGVGHNFFVCDLGFGFDFGFLDPYQGNKLFDKSLLNVRLIKYFKNFHIVIDNFL